MTAGRKAVAAGSDRYRFFARGNRAGRPLRKQRTCLLGLCRATRRILTGFRQLFGPGYREYFGEHGERIVVMRHVPPKPAAPQQKESVRPDAGGERNRNGAHFKTFG